MRTHTRNGRGGGNLVGNGDNGLPCLITHAINPTRGYYMSFSRMLLDGNVPLADATLRDFRCTLSELGLVFCFDRIPLVK